MLTFSSSARPTAAEVLGGEYLQGDRLSLFSLERRPKATSYSSQDKEASGQDDDKEVSDQGNVAKRQKLAEASSQVGSAGVPGFITIFKGDRHDWNLINGAEIYLSGGWVNLVALIAG